MKYVRAFGQFWYDFVVGDDWKIAAAVVLALGVLIVVMTAKLFGDRGLTILGAVLIVTCFAASLAIDTWPLRRRR